MPLQATSGAASYDAFGGGVPVEPVYIEQIFSTYLYTGVPGGAVTVTNNIGLSTNGGLVWVKRRNAITNHLLADTLRGGGNMLQSNTTDASSYQTDGAVTFNTDGFTTGSAPSAPFVSWTFRKQPKFFDVVTYTGNGSNTTIAHSLGSVPGSIIVKRTDTAAAWAVYHRSLANTQYMVLNTTAAAATGATWWNSTTPTSTVFSVGTDASVNASGGTYVAYLFAHDAGGFGLTGTDNVISCGSYTTDGAANATVTLGWEPQFVIRKFSEISDSWYAFDTMRGMSQTNQEYLRPNSSGAAVTGVSTIVPTSTGFNIVGVGGGGQTAIYIAIRRGPMKVPTLGTSVFAPVTQAGGGFDTAGFPVDLLVLQGRSAATGATWTDRLRGSSAYLNSSSTAAESSTSGIFAFDNQTGVQDNFFGSGTSVAYWNFRRAPGFFDEVCYTGTGSATTQTHNLGVVPEMMLTKSRSNIYSPAWGVYHSALGNTKYLNFLSSSADVNASYWNNTTPTGSVFTVNSNGAVNASGATYVAYLFATCAGVSKVGSYTGTGTTKQIDCGFTAGARFVLIKRTDDTGDWYVWDSARGIVAGNDPYLLLNSTAAEVTSTDYVDTYSAGFEISSTAPAAINANGGSFIFLAIA
jgi:hypothetical protein